MVRTQVLYGPIASKVSMSWNVTHESHSMAGFRMLDKNRLKTMQVQKCCATHIKRRNEKAEKPLVDCIKNKSRTTVLAQFIIRWRTAVLATALVRNYCQKIGKCRRRNLQKGASQSTTTSGEPCNYSNYSNCSNYSYTVTYAELGCAFFSGRFYEIVLLNWKLKLSLLSAQQILQPNSLHK